MQKKILILPGDGIGQEVCKSVENIIGMLNERTDCDFITEKALIGGSAYDDCGNPLPQETIDMAKDSDAVLLGAVGGQKWESLDISVRPERGLLGIRKELELFANLRPAIVFDELASASSLKENIIKGLDILIVRELTGGIYFGEPKGIEVNAKGVQEGYNTLRYDSNEINRIGRVAFELARKRNKKLCSVDKANVLISTELWRNNIQTLGDKDYSDVEVSHMYVDNAAMQLVRMPKQFDVIVTTNMFGDILSDCAAMLTGSLGMLPSASLGSEDSNICNALYEPVHGSAPDIAGKDLANPIATILSFSMMLKYSFRLETLSAQINKAVQNVLAKGYRTTDIADENSKVVGTQTISELILNEIGTIIEKK